MGTWPEGCEDRLKHVCVILCVVGVSHLPHLRQYAGTKEARTWTESPQAVTSVFTVTDRDVENNERGWEVIRGRKCVSETNGVETNVL